MIEWLKTWANQVIVAVIIAVIFELIMPNGKNKKYIKMVINLYVLFVIINPIISKFTNSGELNISEFNYEKYFNNNNSIETRSSLNSDEIINNTVEKTLKENIKNKLSEKGYKVTSISIDINSSDNNYVEINSIKLSVEKNVEVDDNPQQNNNTYNNVGVAPLGDPQQNNSSIQINEVEKINVSDTNEEKDTTLRKSEIKKVKKIISEEYDISEDKIEVN